MGDRRPKRARRLVRVFLRAQPNRSACVRRNESAKRVTETKITNSCKTAQFCKYQLVPNRHEPRGGGYSVIGARAVGHSWRSGLWEFLGRLGLETRSLGERCVQGDTGGGDCVWRRLRDSWVELSGEGWACKEITEISNLRC